MTEEFFPILPHPSDFLQSDLRSLNVLEKTFQSYVSLLERIKSLDLDTLVFIQSMGGIHPDGITFHIPPSDQYFFDEAEYGLPQALRTLECDRALASQIQKSFHDVERKTFVLEDSPFPFPVALFTRFLFHLEIPLPRIIVLGVSLEGSEKHYEYGTLIARALASDTQKSLCIGLGNLSHCLSEDALAGYVPQGKEYNDQIISLLESQSFSELFNIDPFLLQEVGEDFYRPMCVGLGLLSAHENPLSWNTLSYEEEKGVGYLSGVLQKLPNNEMSEEIAREVEVSA